MIVPRANRLIYLIGLLFLSWSLPAQVPLLSENFNNCELPSDWTVNVIGNGPATWSVEQPQNPNSDGSSIDGTCMLIMDDDAAGDNTPAYILQFISPVFDGTQYSTLKLNLDVHFRALETSSLKVLIFDGNQYHEAVSFSDGNSTGEQFSEFVHIETDISFYASEQMSVIIQYDDGGIWAWWAGVDNLLVLGEGNANNIILETFNDCALPTGWTTAMLSGENDWQFGLVTNGNAGTDVSMNGSCFAYFDDDGIGQDAAFSTVRLVSPVFDGSQYAQFYLDFDLIFRQAVDLENVSIWISDGTELKEVESIFTNYGGPAFTEYLPVHLDLSTYRSEQMQVVFQYDDGDDWGWWAGIDNVKISGEGFINDLCNNALSIQLGDNCLNGDNRNAIFEGTQPTCSEQNVGGLWYQYNANYTGIVKIETAADFNDVITVFSGDCNTLTENTCSNKDEFGFTGETFYMEVVDGTQYFFRISGQNENFGLPRGNLCIALEAVNAYPTSPSNDDCANAQAITLNTDCMSGNNFNANFNGPTPSLNRKSKADIWYVFEATTTNEIEILSNANFADVLTLYSGTCGDFTEIAGNDSGQSLKVADLVVGQNYYLQVAGYFATLEGSVCVEMNEVIEQVVQNDLCSEALMIPIDGTCVEAQNTLANFEGPNFSCELAAQASVWFQFVAPASGAVKINTGADFVHSLAIYENSCDSLSEVFCTQNPLACDGYFAVNSLVPNQVYFLQVASTATNFGHLEGSMCISILDLNTMEEHLPLDLQVMINCIEEGTGQLTIAANGGVGDYTFQGTSPDEILTTGESYLVVVSDEAGCEKSISGVISCGEAPCALNASVMTTNVNCYGESNGAAVISVAAGIAPYSYIWSNNLTLSSASNLSVGTYSVTVLDVNACPSTISFTIDQPALLLANTTATGETAATANDGTATANPSGGVAPYTYEWNTGATTPMIANLSPDIYNVTISDANGCTVEESVTISSFDCTISLMINTENTSCFGLADGTATVLPENGTSPFNFMWNTGSNAATIENLAAGIYTVTVIDDLGCPSTANVLIEEPVALEASVDNLFNPACFGELGMVDLSANGGTAPYEFVWSNGNIGANQNNLSAGDYSIAVNDANGCSEVLNLSIVAPDDLALELASVQNVSCNGANDGSATIIAMGGNPNYSYLWNDPQGQTTALANDLTPGDYEVTVTDTEGCSNVASVQIVEPDPLTLTVDQVGNATGNNNDGTIEISVLGGATPYIYNWSLDGTTVSDEEDPTDLAPGVYLLLITDNNGCTLTSEEILIESTTGINDPVLAGQIFILPNPTTGKAAIQFDLEERRSVRVQITDVVGRVVLEIEKEAIDQATLSFDLSDYAAGVYPVTIFIGEKIVLKKVVVSR